MTIQIDNISSYHVPSVITWEIVVRVQINDTTGVQLVIFVSQQRFQVYTPRLYEMQPHVFPVEELLILNTNFPDDCFPWSCIATNHSLES